MDRYEDNDTAATATDLSSINGTVSEVSLSIESNDLDWYRFTLNNPGVSGDALSIAFNSVLGDLDLTLFSSNGSTVLGYSDGVGNLEEISLAGLAPGNYFARIDGYDGASNPNYSLTVSTVQQATRDRFEDNDTANAATNLSSIIGTVSEASLSIESNDLDWYRFTLNNPGVSGDALSIAFNSLLGDLDLTLYSSNGTSVLGRSEGVGNLEEISLAGLAAGTYFARIDGYDGASNPDYSLTVSAVPQATVDRFEDNDTAATATDLHSISGTVIETELSIESNDLDWYRFTLNNPGVYGDALSIAFNTALGDLDLRLYSSNGTSVLGSSLGVGNLEEISLAGLAAGTYFARVEGYSGANNPNYSLTVSAVPQATVDRFENNDTASTATDLRSISGTVIETELSIEANDLDWYRFTLDSAGRSGDAVSITFNSALGDLDLRLYSSNGTSVLGSSLGVGNLEEISLAGLAAGTYFARVDGYSSASNPNYALTVSAAPQATGDIYEENDTTATATDLRSISGSTALTSLSIESNDLDWYRFTLDSAGRSGDAVSIAFNSALGDLDLRLYSSNGTSVLGSSLGVDNLEEVSLAGLAAGTYFARIDGYSGDSNPNYSLTVSAAPQATGDIYEENDTAATATDLRSISGSTALTSLSIESNDLDWYRFTLDSAGRAGDAVSIAFNSALGDLDLTLYSSDGSTVMGSSEGVGNLEEIGLAGLAAGTYFARVDGYSSASNPNYALTVSAAPQATGDIYEENDTTATATDLRSISGSTALTSLSIESNDLDWYRFTLDSAGRTGDKVSIAFNNALGDLDLTLYSSNGSTLIGSSTSTGNLEEVSLAGLAAGTYYARVDGYSGASNPDYALTVTAAQHTGLTADQWESNNTSGQATAIRQAEQTLSNATITANDQDWFSFNMPATGALADRVGLSAAGGDVVVNLLNAQSQVITTRQSDATGQVNIPLSNLSAGQYFLKVAGTTTTTEAAYDLNLRAVGTAAAAAEETWTILVYVDGDNNLESAAVGDVNEMESALLSAGINVGVQVDRIGSYDSSNDNWTDTRRGVIVSDNNASVISSTLTSIGEIDMGRGQSLTDFINWGATNLPAQNYALVIWDHGAGALGGSAYDDSSAGSFLSNLEVRQAISSSTLQHIDLLGFDACLMGAVEVATEVASVASILVGSELTEPGEGWDYTTFLTQFSNATQATSTTLAGSIVDAYGAFFQGQQTLSAIDLTKMTPIELAINAFANTMNSASATDWQAVRLAQSRSSTADEGYEFYVDLVSFMTNLQTASTNAAIDAAAQSVIQAVQASVLREVGPNVYNGLTIMFPTTTAELNAYKAASPQFVANTAWEDFLTLYLASNRSVPDRGTEASRSSRATSETTQDFAESLDLGGNARPFNNNTINTSYDLGQINQANYSVPSLNIDSSTDIDWFRFNLPTGANWTPSLSLTVAEASAGVTARLLNAAQSVVAELTTAANTGSLSFNQLTAGESYYLEIRGTGSAVAPAYALNINAFGNTLPSDPLADFAESNGGNNSLNKAFILGGASELARIGALRNLSFNAADLQNGATGGDWFRVDSARTTESNANRVAISDVSSASGNLDLRVYDINGNLLAESATLASSTELVAFQAQVSDVYVQVYSTSGTPTTRYSLSIWNEQSFGATPNADTLYGSANDDVIDSLAGNDVIHPGLGNDIIDGGEGTDTVNYLQQRGLYSLDVTRSGWTVNGPEGLDTLTNIERLQFADKKLALDLGATQNGGQAVKFIGALAYPLAKDAGTFGLILSYFDQGYTLSSISDLAVSIGLTASLAGSGSNADLAKLVFRNVVGGEADAATTDMLVGFMDGRHASYTQGEFLAAVADLELNQEHVGLVGLHLTGLEYL